MLVAGHLWVAHVFKAEIAVAKVQHYSTHKDTQNDNGNRHFKFLCNSYLLMFLQALGNLGRAPL